MKVTDFTIGQRVMIDVPNGRRLPGTVVSLGRKYVHVDLDIVNGGRWAREPVEIYPFPSKPELTR